MKYLTLSNSDMKVILDDEDFGKAEYISWSLSSKKDYIQGWYNNKNTNIGRFILGYSDLPDIDHKNGNIFDNRKENLRNCTRSQNCANKEVPRHSKAPYRGISFDARRNKWKAQITANQKHYHLGNFSDPKEAALAYNKAAIKYFGEFASLNSLI